MKIKIRQCIPEDISQIIKIGKETFKDTYSTHPTADIEVYLNKSYSLTAVKK